MIGTFNILGLGTLKTVFNEKQENQFVVYTKTMKVRLFGLASKELRILAYRLA